ncbi:hypothetical protein JXA59_00570 [Patescibacteria group bacterium]|nr:hypothetical protein [Patescibacteria group bacterium]
MPDQFLSSDGSILPDPAASSERFIEHLFQHEFPDALLEGLVSARYIHPEDIRGEYVVVMLAPGDGGNRENSVRITLGVNVLISLRARLPFGVDSPFQLVLNGTAEQLPDMHAKARDCGLVEDEIIDIDCGPDGVGNTKTQFLAMAQHPMIGVSEVTDLVVISCNYHGPRLRRMLTKYMPHKRIRLLLVDWIQGDIAKALRLCGGEARRIVECIAKGDIDPYPAEMLMHE